MKLLLLYEKQVIAENLLVWEKSQYCFLLLGTFTHLCNNISKMQFIANMV